VIDPADRSQLAEDDFRRTRAYLAPHLFLGGEEGQTYPPPTDLIDEERWESIMALPTDVALATSSYTGTEVGAIQQLQSGWIFSWPEPGSAPFMDDACLLAGEEFDALVFNALHGFYRQAIGCLRNALEIMTVAAGLALEGNTALYGRWREEGQEIPFGQARAWLRDSAEGIRIDAEALPDSVFGDEDSAWLKDRYATLCAYAHSRAGYNNADFWESNGPVYRPRALKVVDEELRETLALCYLLLRLGWPGYVPGTGPRELLAGPRGNWARHEDLLGRRLL
jgi:hypothetical protein